MMKKNYFNFKKAMTAAMMLLSVSMTMTSCADFWEDVFGPDDTPTETPAEPEDEVGAILTSTGATLTVKKLSDITALLEQIKSDIASKTGQEYVVEIISKGLKATSEDDTVIVPTIENSYINLNFVDGITTEVPFVVKGSEIDVSNTVNPAKNDVYITLPETEGVSLEVNMPETNVTLKAADGAKSVVYEDLIVTVVSRYTQTRESRGGIHLTDAIYINNFHGQPGVHKSDTYASRENQINTYVYKTEKGADLYGCNLYIGTNRCDNRWSGGTKQDIRLEDWNAGSVGDYYIPNLKIVKGEVDNITLVYDNYNYSYYILQSLVIDEGIEVRIKHTYHQLPAKTVVAEGKGANVVLQWIFDSINSNPEYDPKEQIWKHYPFTYNYLSNVEKMKNITLSSEILTEEAQKATESFELPLRYHLRDVPTNMENCTLNYDYVDFKQGTKAMDAIENCKFEATNKTKTVYLRIPGQSEEINSYKLEFTDCTFSEGFKFDIIMQSQEYVYNEYGQRIEIYHYGYYDDENNFVEVASEEELPEEIRSSGNYSTWITYQMKDINFTDYHATVSFKNCKLGNDALTNLSDFIDWLYPNEVPDGAYLRFEIDGTSYQAVLNSETGKYDLIPAQ